MFADKRIGTADNIFQDIIFTGDDQILQINGTYKFLILIHNVNGGNIVMFTSLSNECTHGFTDGQFVGNADEVVGHAAADFIFIIGE